MEKPPQLNDPHLLQRLTEGDEDAYTSLILLYQAPLFRFFLFQVHNRDTAEDLVCDTFAALIRALPRLLQQNLNLRAYLYGIARNLLRENGRQQHGLTLTDDLLELLEDLRPDAHEIATQNEHLHLALQAVDNLDEPARQVMLFRYVEEYNLQDISEATGLPLNTVKSIIHRALGRIRITMGLEVKPHET